MLAVLHALLGCHGRDSDVPAPTDSDPGHSDAPIDSDTDPIDTDVDRWTAPESPIVVVFVPDTLGFAAARDTGWCERLQALTGQYGIALACLEGGVSPSSWTAPAHTRLLFPQHMRSDLVWYDRPACDEVGLPQLLDERFGGTYVFGADNPVLSHWRDLDRCGDGSGFMIGADSWYDEDRSAGEALQSDPALRPANRAIEDLLVATATGAPAIAVLNAWEAGGHFPPRCALHPTSPACDELWNLAVEAGQVDPYADRTATFLDTGFLQRIDSWFDSWPEAELRPLLWGTIAEAVDAYAGPAFDSRVERLLSGLQEQGRLDDLVLVVVADHGDNPGVRIHGGLMNSFHTGQPTEWNGIVPVYVAPAALADEWVTDGLIGDATTPWSTPNLAYGLLDVFDVPVPEAWPGPEPIGTATSWSCMDVIDPGGRTAGIRVEGDIALRCRSDVCIATTWAVPGDLTYDPIVLDEIPASLLPWAGSPNWFVDACTF